MDEQGASMFQLSYLDSSLSLSLSSKFQTPPTQGSLISPPPPRRRPSRRPTSSMERLLLYSSSPTSLNINPNSSLVLPRFARIIHSLRPNFPLPTRHGFHPLGFLSSKNDKPSFSSIPCFSSPNSSADSIFQSDSPPDSPKPDFLKPFARKEKVKSSFFVLSALALILIQPVFAPAAFASFQNAAKTGGPAAVAVGRRLIQSELLNSAWTGFFAGCLHTLSGPDHLAALAPLSIGCSRMESAAVGALWGCGHDAGIMGIREASEIRTPFVVALDNGECDVGIYETLEKPMVVGNKKSKKLGFATFATGVVHGLQPDALMIVLPALALPSRVAGAAFLLMFLVGTVISMGSYTAFIGTFSEALKDRVPRITERLTWVASFVAIALGLAIIISQFLGYSLY
ncbi:NicO domain-containing protein [Cucumis melo var. makuwa]|uniref:NicO domain-containing protein n=1 Tax=Cucumis melo var. makuwa TaxID=1194695 RepID=A0A5A7U6H4_CUCMM|nr:NicO domain-containing protein [Cucumis melo var. makuwa]TYK12122.1 NicO domain-containing protein [Cucumis melo var. makuwa]